MTPFGIAGIQMNLQHGSNVDAIEEKINVLMSLYPWVEMVIISELAAHGPLDSFAETMPGITENRFCAMAQKHNIWLIPGSFFELRNNAIFNTAPVINPQGQVIARHRKLFPFCPFEEGVEAGDEFVVFDVPGAGRFGLCICYDMWFPEVLRTLTSMGAEVILHPVLTGTNDREIELNLARSSGALFQSYIIDINGLGVGGVGQSCLIDPSGRVLHQAGETDEFLVTELDFDSVRRQREVGLRSLGQPLKSFRDTKINFTVYNKEQRQTDYLDSLGPLQKPTRESKRRIAIEPGSNINNNTAANDVSGPVTQQFDELSTSPDVVAYNYSGLAHAELESLISPETAAAQQTQLDLTITAKESIDLSAMTKTSESIKMDIDKNNNAVETSDNLKWFKETSAQIKQYIKS